MKAAAAAAAPTRDPPARATAAMTTRRSAATTVAPGVARWNASTPSSHIDCPVCSAAAGDGCRKRSDFSASMSAPRSGSAEVAASGMPASVLAAPDEEQPECDQCTCKEEEPQQPHSREGE